MAVFNSKIYSAIVQDMQDYIIANQDVITDFNEGSVIGSFIESVSLEIEQIYLRTKIGFTNYLPNMPFYAFGFVRQVGIKAAGVVTFSRNVSTASPITIAIGTRISSFSGLEFITTSAGTILAGNTDSDDVSIQALDVGDEYNLPADSINVIDTPILGVDTVTNASGTSNGLDEESEEDFLQRFQAYILGLGKANVYGLTTGALSVNGVRSAVPVEHFPPVDDYVNVSVYIDDGAGNAPAALIEEVTKVLVGDGTQAYPGYKAAGINIEVVAPTVVDVDVTVTVVDTGNVDRTSMSTLIEAAITNYINGLRLGEEVIYNRLVDEIMDVAGVYDLTLSLPAGNVTIGNSQIARVDTITINYSS
jgi:uncharacterized phage protein gp47/JayE